MPPSCLWVGFAKVRKQIFLMMVDFPLGSFAASATLLVLAGFAGSALAVDIAIPDPGWVED